MFDKIEEEEIEMVRCSRMERTWNGDQWTGRRCENHSYTEDTYTVYARSGEEVWCEPCVTEEAFFCTGCEQFHESRYHDSYTRRGWSSEQYCTECAELQDDFCTTCMVFDDDCDCGQSRNGVHDYGYKPDPTFYGPNGGHWRDYGLTYYGIELEVENGTSNDTDEVSEAFNAKDGEINYYLKHDGSLDDGFEIVSHPRTLDSWHGYIDSFSEKLQWLSEQGVRSWDRRSCGLHVHVSKKAFNGKAHMLRFGMLFRDNAEQWQTVAGRTSSYAQFDGLAKPGLVRRVKASHQANHFDAVNFGGESGRTVEVRIWRPSLVGERLLAVIELIDIAVEYTRKMTVQDVFGGQLTWAQFSAWASAQTEYINGKALVDTPRPDWEAVKTARLTKKAGN